MAPPEDQAPGPDGEQSAERPGDGGQSTRRPDDGRLGTVPVPQASASSGGHRNRMQLLGLAIIGLVVCCVAGVLVGTQVLQPGPTPVVAPAPTGPAAPASVPASTAGAASVPGAPPAAPQQQGAPPGAAPGAQQAAPRPPSKPAYNIMDREPIPTGERKQFLDHMAQWRHEDGNYLEQRWDRYLSCIDNGDLTRHRVKQAFLATPRERFCRKQNLSQAYAHGPKGYLLIGYGVTITGPNVVARMTDRLDPQPSDRCLEIGTGSGYQSAVLANLSNHVYSIEIIAPLYKETRAIYDKLIREGYEEYQNVHLKAADGYYGWKEHAPFKKIIVTCAIDHIPPPLLQQLAHNGSMIIPIGPPTAQRILRITKKVDANGKVSLVRDDLYPGGRASRFVPFTTPDGGTHFKG